MIRCMCGEKAGLLSSKAFGKVHPVCFLFFVAKLLAKLEMFSVARCYYSCVFQSDYICAAD